MFPFAATALTLLVAAVLIRVLARFEILWCIIPDNTFAFKTTKANKSGDITEGGGGIVDILHNVPGKKLSRKSHDISKWKLVEGRERRSILFRLLGVTWIGPFRALRTNKIRRFRYGKFGDEEKGDIKSRVELGEEYKDYYLMSSDLTTEFVPFSSELAISVTDVETNTVFELNFLFNIIEEVIEPWRAVVRVADSNSVLAGMIKQRINAIVGPEHPLHFIKASAKSTEQLLGAAKSAITEAEEQVGKRIALVNLVTTDMDKNDRALFELEAKTQMEQSAAMAETISKAEQEIERQRGIAEGKKRINDADADRVTRVLIPLAETELRVRVREAEAYENNETVTHYAPGAIPMMPM